MTDTRDIVERLRDPSYPPPPAGCMALRLSAADEIERKREPLPRWQAENMVEALIKASYDDFIGYSRYDVDRLTKEMINTLCGTDKQ